MSEAVVIQAFCAGLIRRDRIHLMVELENLKELAKQENRDDKAVIGSLIEIRNIAAELEQALSRRGL